MHGKGWFGTSLKCFRKKANICWKIQPIPIVWWHNIIYLPINLILRVYTLPEQMKKMINQKTTDVESLWVYYTMGYYYNEIDNSEQAEKAL